MSSKEQPRGRARGRGRGQSPPPPGEGARQPLPGTQRPGFRPAIQGMPRGPRPAQHEQSITRPVQFTQPGPTSAWARPTQQAWPQVSAPQAISAPPAMRRPEVDTMRARAPAPWGQRPAMRPIQPTTAGQPRMSAQQPDVAGVAAPFATVFYACINEAG